MDMTNDEMKATATMIKTKMVEIGVSENVDDLSMAATYAIRRAQKDHGDKAADIKVSREFSQKASTPYVKVSFVLKGNVYDWAEVAKFEVA